LDHSEDHPSTTDGKKYGEVDGKTPDENNRNAPSGTALSSAVDVRSFPLPLKSKTTGN
jgi:hypothetical protein